MRSLQKILVSIMTLIMIVALTSYIVTKTFASSNLYNNRREANVGVLLYSFDDMFMTKVKQNLENIQKNNEDMVKFEFFDCKNNQAIQNEILNSLSNKVFNVLFVDLIDTKEIAVDDVIDIAKQKGIPLIIFNIDPSSITESMENYYDKVYFLITDSKQLGTLQGDILVKQWNANKDLIDKDKDNMMEYVILQGPPTSTIALERTKYCISAINKSGIKTQELQIKDAYWDKQIAEVTIESLIFKYGNKIEAIISNNDAMAIGAIEALQKYEYNKNDKSRYVSVVGIDALDEAKDLVDKGVMTGTVTQDPVSVAEALYKVGMNLVNNKDPIENTSYKLEGKKIVNAIFYQEYAKQY